MILDDCFITDLLDGDDAAVAKLDEIHDELLAVPTQALLKPSGPDRYRVQNIEGEFSIEVSFLAAAPAESAG